MRRAWALADGAELRAARLTKGTLGDVVGMLASVPARSLTVDADEASIKVRAVGRSGHVQLAGQAREVRGGWVVELYDGDWLVLVDNGAVSMRDVEFRKLFNVEEEA